MTNERVTRTPRAVRISIRMKGILVLAATCAVTVAGANGASASLQRGEMIVYKAGEPVPESELVDLGPPAGLGGTVLEGDPRISARIDYAQDGVLAGVFQATTGKVLIHFPFTEHATILDGEVTLTDETGQTHHFRVGDSYVIRQGTVILWEVRGRRVQKSFFNRTEQSDSPAPMLVYDAHHEVEQCELTDLGPPESLGGTVLAGNPKISARIDYFDDGAAAGVFQATRGDVQIEFPFTEHATVLKGAVTLTDETGQTHHFRVGDSYLIKQHSSIFWHVGQKRVQKSFFNIVEQ